MNQQLDLRLSKQEFLRWVESQPGRYELVGGRVVMMTGGSRNHAKIISGLLLTLLSRLDRSRWSVTGTELAVEIGEDIRYPDAMVEPAGLDGRERSSNSALLLAEVLSPSSIEVDLEDKLDDYTGLQSLQYYLVASQDEHFVRLWRRGADGAFSRAPLELRGADAVVDLPHFGVAFPLGEIYRFL